MSCPLPDVLYSKIITRLQKEAGKRFEKITGQTRSPFRTTGHLVGSVLSLATQALSSVSLTLKGTWGEERGTRFMEGPFFTFR